MELDEFGEIARLFRPLTGGAPEALALLDDAALLSPPLGEELVVTTDTMVAGVHFLIDTPPDLVARKLLRVNLSDLAAKAADPWGWFLNVAWPAEYDRAAREAFARGFAQEQARYGLQLWGGDTVSTPGPLTVGATLIGRAPAGATVRRGGAEPGDVLLVSGTIGDAGLGLLALRGDHTFEEADRATLVRRHQLPEPRLPLREALRAHAAAAADVSDGLVADAGRIGLANSLGVEIELEAMPLSPEAQRWLDRQGDDGEARIRLATSGDDYEVVCAARPHDASRLQEVAASAGVAIASIGRVVADAGVRVLLRGVPQTLSRLGWTHD